MKGTRTPAPELVEGYRRNGWWTDERLADGLRASAVAHPDRIAVVVGDRRISYAELDELVARAAGGLRDLGTGPGDVVSFQLPNSIEAVITWHAAQRIGAVANPITPIYRSREVAFVLAQARTRVVVVPERYRGFDHGAMLDELRRSLPDLRHVVVVGDPPAAAGAVAWSALLESGDPAREPLPVAVDDVAMLLYTSGTTSDPKGVLHTHETLAYDARAMTEWYGLTGDDVIFNPAPVTHASGMLCALVIPARLGATVVLQDLWEPDEALDRVAREGATFMLFATPFLQDLTDRQDERPRTLAKVRYVVCGGADVPRLLVERATVLLGPVVRMYGSSEVPSMTSCTVDDPFDARAGTDGRWMAPTGATLVDDDGRRHAGAGRGEIRVLGPDVCVGYLDGALNDEAFDETGAFCSGDLGEVDGDGYLRVVGRTKDIINRSGEKFSARELEELLYAHPAVDDAAVVAIPDPRTGERACAFVVAHDGTSPSLEELCAYLVECGITKRKLPERLETIDALPRTATGKVQKHLLRAEAVAP